jgi:hypothetical protein
MRLTAVPLDVLVRPHTVGDHNVAGNVRRRGRDRDALINRQLAEVVAFLWRQDALAHRRFLLSVASGLRPFAAELVAVHPSPCRVWLGPRAIGAWTRDVAGSVTVNSTPWPITIHASMPELPDPPRVEGVVP